jgi:rubrerythrin
MDKVSKENRDKEILRIAMQAELDAINLYEQMAHVATNDVIREVLLDVAREEKTHVGEFQTLLLRLDQEQETELTEGKHEIEEMEQG